MSPAQAPFLLDISWSDGVTANHPPPSKCVPPANLAIDPCSYYLPLSPATSSSYALYETKLGAAVASASEPGLATKFPGRVFALSALPTGYRLFEHRKRNKRGGRMRADVYMYGHPSGGRFRSPNEFIPHLLWLLSDITRNRNNCACYLCGRPSSSKGASRTPAFSASSPNDRDTELADPSLYRKGEIVWYAPSSADIARVKPFLPASFSAAHRAWHPAVVLSRASSSVYTLLAQPPRVVCDVSPIHMRPFNAPGVVLPPHPAACWDPALHIATRTYSLLTNPEYQSAFLLGPDKLRVGDLVELLPATDIGARRVGLIVSMAYALDTGIKLRGAVYERLKPGGIGDTSVPNMLEGSWRVALARCAIGIETIVGRVRPGDLATRMRTEQGMMRWERVTLLERETALGVRRLAQ
ncbi:uncharacterized protein V1518DRAFT_405441 [Limtongia smithiae]|uniref:uncharacterized protein n=1 Tax=Limtongia smithiae TaxID=1125753 RepID=UPI0034CD05D6